MELDNKVCVITGGASGIGAATSRAFAAKGARVVVTDINMEGARQVAEEIGGHAITCDVSVEAEVNNLVAETEEQLGPIDLFFNNAAVATGGNPLNTPIDVWQDQWNINVMAHVYAVRAVLPGMLARGQGYLLHTASMAGILTSQGNLTYATTKHAVVGLAEWLSITYHDQGIRVSLLAPLGVRTPMLGDLSSPFAVSAAGPIKEPKDVADMVVSGIQSESFLILTDPIAQTWMERKTNDPERWLAGMRRLQAKMNRQPNA
ncbi:MAG: SDR family oxidoreductase [Gammaproteobacteria bacterium]|nr:SDR family oxidoreductase [Gammaproteobacteria bacterium]MBT5155641.1 SDR family oxidoreductase [Gammaproteobacteria bacterium]MBT6892756.1 SDR family oxidoreductase [Gammaproteobacteria bacterium]MBT7879651.1 SDR family oxidoreductase [Gammaproteobacteria bacterium]